MQNMDHYLCDEDILGEKYHQSANPEQWGLWCSSLSVSCFCLVDFWEYLSSKLQQERRKKAAGACENSSVGLHTAWAAWRDKKTKNIPVIIFKQQQQPPAHVQAG